MRQKRGSVIVVLAMVVVIGTIFLAGTPELSRAQNAPFKSYQLLVYCEDSQVASATFWHDVQEQSMGVKILCAGNCPDGAVPLANALAGLPAAVSAALRAKVDKHQADAVRGNGSALTCLLPPAEKKPDCRKKSDSPTGKNCCDNPPEKGFVFSSGSGNVYSEPRLGSSIAQAPTGGRYVYTKTTKTNDGQTWYYLSVPGGRTGWMAGRDLSCTRPKAQFPSRPLRVFPSPNFAKSSSAQAGSRG